MNLKEFQQLQAERAALEKLLTQLPESSVIERIGLESRKKEVDDELASQALAPRQPIKTRLTFSGKPIVGSRGVFAEFAAAAVSAFADAVAAIGASQNVQLGARGVIPNREDYRLLITGTALGSFGFELEEAPVDDPSLIESAIEQTRAIMLASVGSDDELADAISEADPRALEALRKFLKTISEHDAVCSLEFKDKTFQFVDVGQVRQSEARLSQDNIHEKDRDILGKFLGVLPNRRAFEFQTRETNEVIAGKVGPTIQDATAINRLLDKSVSITVHTKQVGSGRPRFTLLAYEEIANKH